MTQKFRPVRGMSDIYGEDARKFNRVIDAARQISRIYGFEPIFTPITEYADVFCRVLGETSDVVSKEMYRFEDKGGDEMVLRPEFTAGVARAYVTNGMSQEKPLKFFSYGPLFRYERPQKGRRRQFHQLNYEFFGASSPFADVDVIVMACALLRKLDILEKTTPEINSLGDPESRQAYRAALVDYLTPYKDELSDDSKRRLESNPLRILDSKNPRDKEICENAPTLSDALNDDSKRFFDETCQGLSDAGVAYKVNPRLVRGLDYYCHTAFEFVSNDLGAQNTVLAGGRYDGLISQMGGDVTPAVGFAAGVERLCELIAPPPPQRGAVFCISAGDEAAPYMHRFMRRLHEAGVPADRFPEGNLRKQFKIANKKNAVFVVTAGSDEMQNGTIRFKDMRSGDEAEKTLDETERFLREWFYR